MKEQSAKLKAFWEDADMAVIMGTLSTALLLIISVCYAWMWLITNPFKTPFLLKSLQILILLGTLGLYGYGFKNAIRDRSSQRLIQVSITAIIASPLLVTCLWHMQLYTIQGWMRLIIFPITAIVLMLPLAFGLIKIIPYFRTGCFSDYAIAATSGGFLALIFSVLIVKVGPFLAYLLQIA